VGKAKVTVNEVLVYVSKEYRRKGCYTKDYEGYGRWSRGGERWICGVVWWNQCFVVVVVKYLVSMRRCLVRRVMMMRRCSNVLRETI